MRVRGFLVRVVLAVAVLLVTACGGSGPGGTSTTPGALPDGMPAPPPGAFDATVERVVDGDTFVAQQAGRHVRVRLIGIDAPESVKPGAAVECHGKEASRLLADLLDEGTTVRAAFQTERHRDPNGRDLWDVWLPDGRFLQAVLVGAGAAEAREYRPHVAHAGYLEQVEEVARAGGAGLHGRCG